MADVTRNVLNAVHAVNVVLEVLLTSEHFSAMLTTIILLALFGLLSTMCFNFVSLKKLENFSTNVASEGKKRQCGKRIVQFEGKSTPTGNYPDSRARRREPSTAGDTRSSSSRGDI